MHVKDDVPVAAVASGLQPDRISRSGEQYLPAAASSSLKPSRVTRSANTATQAASPLSFPDSEGSWKNARRRSILPPRRAAEDAPVTAQHDVPRWARGR